MSERKLAYITVVEEIKPIQDADAIEHVRVGGWWVVDKKSLRQVGDKVIYAEIDAWIPEHVAPFLTKGTPKTYNGVVGNRLRTVKLRKALSQGLLLSLTDETKDFSIGDDVTSLLGIIKWEPPAEFKSADAAGLFPSFIRKTDQERIQNVRGEVEEFIARNPNITWEVTEKCEGSSCTIFANNGEFGVCSRNLELKLDLEDNTFVKNSIVYRDAIMALNRNLAFQGELIGPGIQGNIYNLQDHEYRVFDVFDIDAQEYVSPIERLKLVKLIGAKSAPDLEAAYIIDIVNVDELLALADGKTVIGTSGHLREGLVFKANSDERFSFKVISNAYLLKSNI